MTDDLEVIVKVVPKSRSLRLRVMADSSVVLTAPRFTSRRFIDEFIQKHEAWIKDQRRNAVEKLTALTARREKLFFRGQEFDFRLSVSPTKKPGLEFANQTLVVTSASEDHDEVRQIIEKHYRSQAIKYFNQRVPLLADLVGRDVTKVTIRSQRSRWGSCSSRNTISLNWRLIMAPDSVSDYVIYHELAHLTHMNHSRAFWRLVKDYCSGCKEAEQWLKDHHQLLQF